MWENPYLWSSPLGVLVYCWLAWGGDEPFARQPIQMLQLAGAGFAVAILFLLLAWIFAALGYGTTWSQLIRADIPGWQFRKTIYLFYTFTVCTGLCLLHAGLVWYCRALFGHARS